MVTDLEAGEGGLMGKHFDVSGTSTRFGSAADFKFAMDSGCETEFIWRGVRYGAIRYGTGGGWPMGSEPCSGRRSSSGRT